jgi:hypothetical protein
MNCRICRRDFLNSTLLASGGLLLGHLAPRALLAEDHWTGYGGVGDYRDSNGNTAEVMNAAHQIRDHVFDTRSTDVIDTGEAFDCVVVGGGISGLAAPGLILELAPIQPAPESASGRCARSATARNAGKPSACYGEYPVTRWPSSVLLGPAGQKTDVSKFG